MFKHYYVVRYGTASLSITASYRVVKAYSRKNAYKRVKKTLPARYLVTDIHRVSRRFVKQLIKAETYLKGGLTYAKRFRD